MTTWTSGHEALCAVAQEARVLQRCRKHGTFYVGPEGADAALPMYDRHLRDLRDFFPTPVHFYTAMKRLRYYQAPQVCPECANGVVRFV